MKVTMIVSTIAVLALGGLGWQDTAGYRAARAAYQSMAQEQLPRHEQRVREDEARYQRCDPLRAENPASNTIDFTVQGRVCLIDALQRAASLEGTLVLVRNASVALGKSPDDQALRTAALDAITRARGALAGERAYYARQEQFSQAYTESRLMRLLASPPPQGPGFERQAALLDQAEYAIHLPRLHQDQQIWRLESLLPQRT